MNKKIAKICVIVISGGVIFSLMCLYSTNKDEQFQNKHITPEVLKIFPVKETTTSSTGVATSKGHMVSNYKADRAEKNNITAHKDSVRKTMKADEGTLKVKNIDQKPLRIPKHAMPSQDIQEKIMAVVANLKTIRLAKLEQDTELPDSEENMTFAEISPEELMAMLDMLAEGKKEYSRTDALDAIDAILLDAEYFDALTDAEAEQLKSTMQSIVGNSLKDADGNLRLRALETLERLPDDISSILYCNTLSGDFPDVKEKLLLNHAGSNAFNDLALSFHALDDKNPDIAQIARENILAVTGQQFDSSEKAFEWWETQQ